MCIYIYIYICMCIYIYIYISVCVCVCVCVCVFVITHFWVPAQKKGENTKKSKNISKKIEQ